MGVVIEYFGWFLSEPDLTGTLIGQVVLTAVAAAVTASVSAQVAVTWMSSASPARKLALGPSVVLVPAVLAVLAKLAWASRESALDRAMTGRLFGQGGGVGHDLHAELGWLMMASLLALVLFPTVGSAMARAAIGSAPRLLGAGLTVLATTGALLACAYVLGFAATLASIHEGGTVPRFESRAHRHAALLDGLRDLDGALATGGWTLVAIAIGTSALVLRRRARGGKALFTTAGLALSALAFAAGLAAFVATRDHAWDRQHPQRLSDPDNGFPFEEPLEAIAGLRMSCSDLEIGPLLEIDTRGRVAIDQRPMSSPARLAEELASLRRMWTILHPTERFAGAIILRAQPDTALAPIAPYLERARTTGYQSLFVDAYTTVAVSTRTLGVVPARRACPARVELTGSEPLPRTIEALVREIQDGRTTLALPR